MVATVAAMLLWLGVSTTSVPWDLGAAAQHRRRVQHATWQWSALEQETPKNKEDKIPILGRTSGQSKDQSTKSCKRKWNGGVKIEGLISSNLLPLHLLDKNWWQHDMNIKTLNGADTNDTQQRDHQWPDHDWSEDSDQK